MFLKSSLLALCRIVSQKWNWYESLEVIYSVFDPPAIQPAATNDTKEVRKDPSFVIADRISVDFRTFCPFRSISTYIEPRAAVRVDLFSW